MCTMFVYNSKCARTTLNKVLNNGGLSYICGYGDELIYGMVVFKNSKGLFCRLDYFRESSLFQSLHVIVGNIQTFMNLELKVIWKNSLNSNRMKGKIPLKVFL